MTNLLTNGGFQTAGAGGADVWGTWTETASDGAIASDAVVFRAHDSTYVLSAKLTAGVTKDTKITQQVTVVPGLMYRLIIWSLGDTTTGGRVKVENAAESVILTNGGASYTLPVAAEWAKTTLNFEPGADAHVHVTFTCPNLNAGVVNLDDCELEQYCLFTR